MRFSFLARLTLRTWMVLTLLFLYLPLLVVAILSFNTANTLGWPPKGFTTSWWSDTWNTDGPREALWNSVKLAVAATAIAIVLGTLAAIGMQRYRFFGKNAFSFLFVLPIALPGIVTGIALQNTFNRTIDVGPIDFRIGFLAGLKAFTAAVLGGIGNIQGAVLGGLVLGVVEAFATQFIPGQFGGSAWKDVWAFVLLIVVLVFRPQGLLGARVVDRA
jgi:ABC-type spermidine/putrescine transport system permease subunit II